MTTLLDQIQKSNAEDIFTALTTKAPYKDNAFLVPAVTQLRYIIDETDFNKIMTTYIAPVLSCTDQPDPVLAGAALNLGAMFTVGKSMTVPHGTGEEQIEDLAVLIRQTEYFLEAFAQNTQQTSNTKNQEENHPEEKQGFISRLFSGFGKNKKEQKIKKMPTALPVVDEYGRQEDPFISAVVNQVMRTGEMVVATSNNLPAPDAPSPNVATLSLLAFYAEGFREMNDNDRRMFDTLLGDLETVNATEKITKIFKVCDAAPNVIKEYMQELVDAELVNKGEAPLFAPKTGAVPGGNKSSISF